MLGARYKKIASSCPFGWVGNCNRHTVHLAMVMQITALTTALIATIPTTKSIWKTPANVSDI
jgi:hypothetical protein